VEESKTTNAKENFNKVIGTLYQKWKQPYLDHLWQGGLVENVIHVTFNPETNELEAKVEHVHKY
jgi:hypothetical protein